MSRNYSTSFTVDQSPEEVYAAVTNVRGWWSEEIVGKTDELGEFKHQYQDIHRCIIKITELVPGNKVVWHVVDNYFNFITDNSEWKDTDIVFEIAKKGDRTELTFTHVGLVPSYECYNVCSDAWGLNINGSLRKLIVEGKGQPRMNDRIVHEHGLGDA